MKITVFNRENGFHEIEINQKDIKVFRIMNRIRHNKDGRFKKFEPFYKIQIGFDLYDATKSTINKLKQELKGLYTIEKDTITQQKGFMDKKCTDWTYRMIKEG